MLVSIPEWADAQQSRDLPNLRARGEGQDLEFKKEFPRNTSDLAKEIAAFATTNAGTILIGVDDAGDLVGLPDVGTSLQRDELLSRLQGICRGTVKPAITPVVKWAVENGAHVLVVLVPRGSQPVYYSSNVPYVRHLTEARPAEPHEVIERIQEYLTTANIGGADEDPYSEYLGRLASVLIDVLVYAEETGDRQVNPWLDIWRAQYEHAASELRSLANESVAIEREIADDLSTLAGALDSVAHFRMYMGCAAELNPMLDEVREQTKRLKERYIDVVPLSDVSLQQVRDVIIAKQRQLGQLTDRMADLVNDGRVEDLQSEASEIGGMLLRLSYYNLSGIGDGFAERLRTAARDLHLVETARLYMDGGASIQAIVDRVESRSTELAGLVGELRST